MVSLAYRAGVFLRASAGLMRGRHLGLSKLSSFIMTPIPSVAFVTCPTPSVLLIQDGGLKNRKKEYQRLVAQNTPALWAIASLIRRRFHVVVDFPAHSCVALALPSLTNGGLLLRSIGNKERNMLQTIEGECRQSLLLRLKNYVHQLPLPPHSKLEVVRSLRESWIKRNSVTTAC